MSESEHDPSPSFESFCGSGNVGDSDFALLRAYELEIELDILTTEVIAGGVVRTGTSKLNL